MKKFFSFSGTIDRKTYVTIAFIGVIVKHIVDLAVAGLVFHRYFSPLNYLVPLGVPTPITQLESMDLTFVAVMTAVAIPFAWVGMSITVRRFRAIGWPLWTAVFFFVPIANIVTFALAAMWPESSRPANDRVPAWLARLVPQDRFGTALVAVAVSAVMGTALVALGTRTMQSYGWGLFAAIPFAQGAIAAMLAGTHTRQPFAKCCSIAVLSIALTCLALLAVALEGAICIAMAAPLAIVFALMGALLGYVIQNRDGGMSNAAAMLICFLVAPTIMGAEEALPRDIPTYRVESSVIINAPASVVWTHVVSFPELPPPTESQFLLGVAYPVRAKIDGVGVGAVRYCEFSTGDFVEPITVWEPGRKLAFNVVRSAQPMRELSPYPGLDTAHLHDYMISKHGQFVLEALPGNRTRLIGTTWYQHHLWPASYWALYSDAIIHSIHLRVLNHIKTISEKAS